MVIRGGAEEATGSTPSRRAAIGITEPIVFEWFLSLADARRIIEAWRRDYYTPAARQRPGALGYRTPDEFERAQPER